MALEIQSTFNSYQIHARKSEKKKTVKRCYSKHSVTEIYGFHRTHAHSCGFGNSV